MDFDFLITALDTGISDSLLSSLLDLEVPDNLSVKQIKLITYINRKLHFDTEFDLDFINNVLANDSDTINKLSIVYEYEQKHSPGFISAAKDFTKNYEIINGILVQQVHTTEYIERVGELAFMCLELHDYLDTYAMWKDLGSNIYDYVSSSNAINNNFVSDSFPVDWSQLLILDKDIFFCNYFQYDQWNNPFIIEQAARVDYIYSDSCIYNLPEAPYQLYVDTKGNMYNSSSLLKSSFIDYPDFVDSMWECMNDVHVKQVIDDPLNLEHIEKTGTYHELIDEGTVKPEQIELKRDATQTIELLCEYQQGYNDVDKYWREFYINHTGLVRTHYNNKEVDFNREHYWLFSIEDESIESIAFARVVDGVPDNTLDTVRYPYEARITEFEGLYKPAVINNSYVSGLVRTNLILFGSKYIDQDPIIYYSHSQNLSWLDWIFYKTLWVWRLYDSIVNTIIYSRSYFIDPVEVGLSGPTTYSDRYTYLFNKHFEELPDSDDVNQTLYWASISIIGISLIFILIEPVFFVLINFSRYWLLCYSELYRILYKPRIRKRLKAIVRYIKRIKSLIPGRKRGVSWNKKRSWRSNFRRNKWIYIRSFELGKWYYWIRKRVFHKQKLRAFYSTDLYNEYTARMNEYLRYLKNISYFRFKPLSRIRRRNIVLLSFRQTLLRRLKKRKYKRYIYLKSWSFLKANYGRYSFMAVYELILLITRASIFIIRAIFKIIWYIICYLLFTEFFITGGFIIGLYLWRLFVLQLSLKIKESFHKSVWRFFVRAKNLYITISYYPFLFSPTKRFFETFSPYEIFYHVPKIYINWVKREHDYLFTKIMREWLPLPQAINEYEWRNIFIHNTLVVYISILAKTISYGLLNISYHILNDILMDVLKRIWKGNYIMNVYVLYLKIRLFFNKILIASLLLESRIMKYFVPLLIFAILIPMFKYFQFLLITSVLVPSIWLGLFKLLLTLNNILLNGLFKSIGYILCRIGYWIIILPKIFFWFLKRTKIVFILLLLYYMGYFNPVSIVNIYSKIYLDSLDSFLNVIADLFHNSLIDASSGEKALSMDLRRMLQFRRRFSIYEFLRNDRFGIYDHPDEALDLMMRSKRFILKYRYYHDLQVWFYDLVNWNRFYDKNWPYLWAESYKARQDPASTLAEHITEYIDEFDDRLWNGAPRAKTRRKIQVDNDEALSYFPEKSTLEAKRLLDWMKIHGRKHIPILVKTDEFPYYRLRKGYITMWRLQFKHADLWTWMRWKRKAITVKLPRILSHLLSNILWQHIWLDIEHRPYWPIIMTRYPGSWISYYYPILIRVNQIYLFLAHGKLISDLILFYWIPKYLYSESLYTFLYERWSFSILSMNKFFYHDLFYIRRVLSSVFLSVFLLVKRLLLLFSTSTLTYKVWIPYYNFVWRDWFIPLIETTIYYDYEKPIDHTRTLLSSLNLETIYCDYKKPIEIDFWKFFFDSIETLQLKLRPRYDYLIENGRIWRSIFMNWVHHSLWYWPNYFDNGQHLMEMNLRVTWFFYKLFKNSLDTFLSHLRISPEVLESRIFRDRDYMRELHQSKSGRLKFLTRARTSFTNIYLNGQGWSPVLNLLDIPDQITVSDLKNSINLSIRDTEYANRSALLMFIGILKYTEMIRDESNPDILAIYPNYINLLRVFSDSLRSTGSEYLRSPDYLNTSEFVVTYPYHINLLRSFADFSGLTLLETVLEYFWSPDHLNTSEFVAALQELRTYTKPSSELLQKMPKYFDYADYFVELSNLKYKDPDKLIQALHVIGTLLDEKELFLNWWNTFDYIHEDYILWSHREPEEEKVEEVGLDEVPEEPTEEMVEYQKKRLRKWANLNKERFPWIVWKRIPYRLITDPDPYSKQYIETPSEYRRYIFNFLKFWYYSEPKYEQVDTINKAIDRFRMNDLDLWREFIPTLQISGSSGGTWTLDKHNWYLNYSDSFDLSHTRSCIKKSYPDYVLGGDADINGTGGSHIRSCIKKPYPDYVLGGDGLADISWETASGYQREYRYNLITNYVRMIISYSFIMYLRNRDWTFYLCYNNEYLWTLFRNYYKNMDGRRKYDFYDPLTGKWFVDRSLIDSHVVWDIPENKKIFDIEEELILELKEKENSEKENNERSKFVSEYGNDDFEQEHEIEDLDEKRKSEKKRMLEEDKRMKKTFGRKPKEILEEEKRTREQLCQKATNLLIEQIPSNVGKLWFSLYTKYIRYLTTSIVSKSLDYSNRHESIKKKILKILRKHDEPVKFNLEKEFVDSVRVASRIFDREFATLPIMDQVIMQDLIYRFETDNDFDYNPYLDFDSRRLLTDPSFHSYSETLSYARDTFNSYVNHHENHHPLIKAIEFRRSTIFEEELLNTYNLFERMSQISESDYAYIQKFYEFFEDVDSLLFNNEGPDCFFYKSMDRFFSITDYSSGAQKDQYLFRFTWPLVLRSEANLFLFLFLLHQIWVYAALNGFAGAPTHWLFPPSNELDIWLETIFMNNFKFIHDLYHTGIAYANRSITKDGLSTVNSYPHRRVNHTYGWDLDWINKLNPLYDYNLILWNCTKPFHWNLLNIPYYNLSNLYYLLETKLSVYGSYDRFLWRWISISSLILCSFYLYTCRVINCNLIFMESFIRKHEVFLNLILKIQDVINLKYSVIGFNHYWINWFKGRDLINSINWFKIVKESYNYHEKRK